MNFYDLPTSLTVGGVERKIRTGWRAIVDILIALNDPEFDAEQKAVAMIQIIYPDWRDIPPEDMEEAVVKASEFIDACDRRRYDGKSIPRVIDWEQDIRLIIPAINKEARSDIRKDPDIHWWTVYAWFMASDDDLLATVINIRRKQAMGKKLEKWEEEFCRLNKQLVEMRRRETPEDRAAKAYFEKWLY